MRSARLAVAIGGAVLAAAFLARIANLSTAFAGGLAQFPPLDDLYQFKRFVYSVRNFPRFLEFDPDRGVAGEFCHWPPLYPLLAASAARLASARTPAEIAAVVTWIPPVVSALFAGVVAGTLTRRWGPAAGLVAGLGLAFSPPFLDVSHLGDIDHHFWEPPLLTALVGAALSLRKAGERDVVLRGALFGLALLAALFIQTTFLFAAGVLAAALLLFSADEPRTLAAAAVGYGVALLGVTAWRLARPPGIPDYEWYLGWPQIAALAAAAIACAAGAALVRGPRTARILVSVAAGTAVALAVPHAALGLVDGAALFGDPWIRTMVECRSVFENEAPWRTALYVFGGGVLLLPVLLFGAAREKSRGRLLFGLVALVYVAAAVSSLRFSIAAAPLVAISAAAVVGDAWRAGRRLLAGAAALVALGPGLVFAAPSIATPSPSVPPEAAPMLRVTSFLRAHPGGRVLGPLSWGHLFDVAGLHPAVLDNFGSMIGREPFRARLRVFLLTDEAAVARWCRASGVRWVVLEPPFTALPLVVESLGEPLLPYLRPPPCPGGAFTFTRRTQATFWWRAFYDGGRARPEMGRFGTPFRSFRLAYRDAQPAGVGPYRGPSAEVWELVEASPSP